MEAQWRKLNSGEWGAKVLLETPFDAVEAGDEITVTTKAGKQTVVKVRHVIHTGDDAYTEGGRSSLVAIERLVDDRE